MSIGIGIGVAIAVAIGCMDLQKPIATAITTATPIPMIATQSEHDLRPDPHFLLKRPPNYGLTSNAIPPGSAGGLNEFDSSGSVYLLMFL